VVSGAFVALGHHSPLPIHDSPKLTEAYRCACPNSSFARRFPRIWQRPRIDRLVGTVAVSTKGVPFDSVDNDPVYVLVMLVSPQERPSDHLRALEGVSRCLKDKEFVQSLRKAASPQEIWDLICKHDRGA